MRILYIINAFSWGGAEKLVYDLAIGIRPFVEHVSVIGLYRKGDNTESDMVAALADKDIKTYVLGKEAGTGRINGILEILSYAKKNQITVIHGHCSVPMLFGKIVGWLSGIPVVCTIHNTRGYSKIKEITTSWMCKKYISIGQAAEEYMIEVLNISPAKIVRIYNAINTDVFVSDKKNDFFWNQFGGKENEKVILNVARVNEQKNQMCLLRSIKMCVNRGERIHAYILGSYDESSTIYKELRSYISDEGIDDYITFLGMHKNVNEFLANADCFVMTSWFEGLSVAFLEAVISGTHIITTDLPFVHELQKIGKCATIIDQDDSEKLAELLIESEWEAPSRDTINSFVSKFGMEQFVHEHLNVYHEFENNNKHTEDSLTND